MKNLDYALYGAKAVSEDRWKSLSKEEKWQINNCHKKAQLAINQLKNQKLNKFVSETLGGIFTPKTYSLFKSEIPLAKGFNTMTFKELGITREEVEKTLKEKQII